MATIQDVAAYILEKQGEMTAMKLQKLVYYSQAWSLVWDDTPLFEGARFEAWANGPVAPVLYNAHRGMFRIGPGQIQGNAETLNDNQKETVDSVLSFYGHKSAQWLSDLTHIEQPWLNAREGLIEGQRGNSEITFASMVEYYGSL